MANKKSSSRLKFFQRKSGDSLKKSDDGVGSFEGYFINEILVSPKVVEKRYDHVVQDDTGKILRVKRDPNWIYFIAKKNGDYWLSKQESFVSRREKGIKKGEHIKKPKWIMRLPISLVMYKERFFAPHYVEYNGKSYIVILSRSRRKKVDSLDT